MRKKRNQPPAINVYLDGHASHLIEMAIRDSVVSPVAEKNTEEERAWPGWMTAVLSLLLIAALGFQVWNWISSGPPAFIRVGAQVLWIGLLGSIVTFGGVTLWKIDRSTYQLRTETDSGTCPFVSLIDLEKLVKEPGFRGSGCDLIFWPHLIGL